MIDKRINYAWGGPGGKSPGTSPSYGGGGGGGGGERRYEAPAPKAAPRPAPRPTMADIAGPTPSGISPQQSIAMTGNIGSAGKSQKEVQASIDSDKASQDRGTSLYGGPTVKEAIKKADIKNMIKSQQEEKYGPTADLTKFGETISPIDKVMSKDEKDFTIEDKRIIEEWESAQDWDKVKDLSKKGYSSKEINDAMDKGLLTKTDPQSVKTNLLSRGINSLRNIIPKTGLESSLLNSLTKNAFAPTDGGMFDLKKMGFNLAKNYGMKKLGLGWLNPYLGLASLFGFDPYKSLTNKFAKKPAFDVDAASKLGLQANRVPTQKTDTLTARARDAYEPDLKQNVIAKNIAKFTGEKPLTGRSRYI